MLARLAPTEAWTEAAVRTIGCRRLVCEGAAASELATTTRGEFAVLSFHEARHATLLRTERPTKHEAAREDSGGRVVLKNTGLRELLG